ncbi:hypothetical protein, no similarity [Maudiozyma barnettii]|uniref:Plasma membrane proteolipid 3 n=1 Tax=Maudiozyma barnettii TaxID=61262 RepID=A0A8H2VGY1_9SACH|nr:hypothetical protein, no similarity [Kazachstania barnettii]CAB4255220.1 hypothetical protein, no similarity [Kazachstania barnettii]CAD1783628.1 hypothetical protein, no similarity [Kazachstania barnettii]
MELIEKPRGCVYLYKKLEVSKQKNPLAVGKLKNKQIFSFCCRVALGAKHTAQRPLTGRNARQRFPNWEGGGAVVRCVGGQPPPPERKRAGGPAAAGRRDSSAGRVRVAGGFPQAERGVFASRARDLVAPREFPSADWQRAALDSFCPGEGEELLWWALCKGRRRERWVSEGGVVCYFRTCWVWVCCTQTSAVLVLELETIRKRFLVVSLTGTCVASGWLFLLSVAVALSPPSLPSALAASEKCKAQINRDTTTTHCTTPTILGWGTTTSKPEKMEFWDWILVFIAVFVPPVAVFLKRGLKSKDLWINVLLAMFGFFPGLIHALYVISTHPSRLAHVRRKRNSDTRHRLHGEQSPLRDEQEPLFQRTQRYGSV